MKRILHLLAVAALASPHLAAKEPAAKPDAFEAGMREAMEDYRKGDSEAVTAKLRELVKLMEEEGAAKVGEVLPAAIGEWKGESLKRDDLGHLGGGISISRNYVSGERQILAKVIKDAPLVKDLIPLIGNEELMKLSNRKTYRISGETAALEGERKLQMVVDGRILVELVANEEAGENELVTVLRKLDLDALAKLK